MDKKTFAQFLLFSTIVLVVWWLASYVIFKRPAQPKAAPAPREVARLPATERAAAKAAAVRPSPEGVPAKPALPAAPPKPALEPVEAILANELIETHWTSQGAALRRLELRDERYRAPYKEADTRPALALLRDFQDGLYSDTIETVTFFSAGAQGAAQEIDTATADVVYELAEKTDDRLVFQTDVHDGKGHSLRVRKVVTMPSAAYHYEVALEFDALSGAPFEFSCGLRGPAGIERETLQTRFLGTRVGIFEGLDDYEIAKESPGTLVKKGPQRNESADIAWAGVVNHYFVAVMEPEDRQWVGTVVSKAVTDTDIQQARRRWRPGTVQKESARLALARQNAAVVINTVRRRLETDRPQTEHYRFIAAPKEDGILKSYDVGLPGLIELGL
ncbi:MAG: YidC/Oxa1 family insertase periplasmic-domain containing protein, partial [Planctomycetota bacterium]